MTEPDYGPPSVQNSNEQQPKRVIGRPFLPGQSGNPGGRPSASKRMRELAQAQLDKGIEFLASVINDPSQKTADRIAATRELLDRGFGKPTQPLSGSDDPDKPQLPSIAISFVEPGKE